MAHFIEAEILGLAGRTDMLNIKFDRQVNVIYGLNGSGKTSLLKILHSAMANEPAILEGVPFIEATVQIYSLDYERVFTRNIKKKKKKRKTPKAAKIAAPTLFTEETDSITEIWTPQSEVPEQFVWSQSPLREDGKTKWRHRYLPTTRLHITEGQFFKYSMRSDDATLSEEVFDKFFAESLDGLWANYSADV